MLAGGAGTCLRCLPLGVWVVCLNSEGPRTESHSSAKASQDALKVLLSVGSLMACLIEPHPLPELDRLSMEIAWFFLIEAMLETELFLRLARACGR